MRLDPYRSYPELIEPLRRFAGEVAQMGLEPSLVDLVKIRVSQVNNCAACLDIHLRDARWSGESEQRIRSLQSWRRSSCYSQRERAALAWAEALTRVAETPPPDETYKGLALEFSPEEQVKLSLVIIAINGFNRLGIGFKVPPADIERGERQAA
jgi:AhpD family alkylhydroperoxidase